MHLLALDEGDQAGHELGAMAVVLRAVVQVEHQRGDVGKARLVGLPPLLQPIHDAVAGHLGSDVGDEEFIGLREEETDRRHRRLRPKVVVRRRDGPAPRAAPREGADLNRRFGVHRHPQHVRRRVGLRVHPCHRVEDGVGLRDFFWGCVLATFVRV